MDWTEGTFIDFEKIVSEKVFGQRRTSKIKRFTFFDGDYVYKGPYSKEKLEAYQSRVGRIEEWGLPLAVLPEKTFFPSDVGYFVRFEDLSKGSLIEFEDHKESWEGGYSYKVLIRGNLIKVSDALKKKENDWIYDFVPEITLTLCGFYILKVGDIGLYNLLADLEKKEVYIIDFEENRGVSAEDPNFFYFSKPPAEKIRIRWKEEVEKNRDGIIEALREIPISETEHHPLFCARPVHAREFRLKAYPLPSAPSVPKFP